MKPDISIVIPYFNKQYEIDLVLRAIANQEYDLSSVEVVIVDDGSPEDIRELVAEYVGRLRILYHRRAHSGNRGANRNFGAANSSGGRILFLDSDMVMEPDCLSRYATGCRDGKDIVLGTRQMLFEFDRKYIHRGVIDRQFEILRSLPASNDERISHLNYESETGKQLHGQWQLLYSHSFMVFREAFEAVGGFDEEFSRNWGAEDVELGYRFFKSGCRISVDRNIRAYHLYHPTNHDANIQSLKRNYEVFLRKHPEWHVELFTREFETWVVENIRIQERIEAGDHVLDDRIHPLPWGPGSGRKVLAGIDCQAHPGGEDPVVYLPGRRAGGAFRDCFGINTVHGDEQFEEAIVSSKYLGVSPGLFLKIASEMQRISRTLRVVGPESEAIRARRLLQQYHDREVVIFTTAQEIHGNLNRGNLLNLALACDAIGMTVGVQMFYDPRLQEDINSGYLKFEDPGKRKRLSALLSHGLNFVGDSVPSVMDFGAARRTSRGIGTRILWEDFPFQNQEPEVGGNWLPKYRRVLFRTSADSDRFPALAGSGILSIGFDGDLIGRVLAAPRASAKKGGFVFLWSCIFTSEWSFLDVALEAFVRTHARNPLVVFRVVVPGNFIRLIRNEYRNAAVEKIALNGINHIRRAYGEVLATLKARYASHANIVFIEGVLSEEDYAAEIRDADTLIDTHGHLAVNPLVLMAVALGKKPIVPDDGRYADYRLGDNLATFKTVSSSALYNSGQIDFRFVRDDDPARYQLVNKPVLESLALAMARAGEEPAAFIIEENVRKEFAERFNWLAVARRFQTFLKESF